MFRISKLYSIIIGFIAIIFLVNGCENDYPPSIWDPNYANNPVPIIDTMTPAGGTLAGVGTITITGNHFVAIEPYNDYNKVIFDDYLADVVSVTSTEIVVKSPVLIKDSIKVKVASRGATNFSEPYIYNLTPAVQTWGFLNPGDIVAGIAADVNENIYVSVKGQFSSSIKKIDTQGMTSELAPTSFLSSPALVFGPDNAVYAIVTSGRINKIVKFDATSGEETDFVNLTPNVGKDHDFDPDNNLWVAVRQVPSLLYPCDILKVTQDGTKEVMATYEAFLQSIRVFNDGDKTYVYVVGYKDDEEQKIWRQEILSNGTLGPTEEVLDILGESLMESKIVNTITFSEVGTIYMGTGVGSSTDAIFTYNPLSGDVNALYPGIISPVISEMVWGEGQFLYASHVITDEESEVLKIDLRQSGGPYYGRQ
jgi:hypothetical protein